MQILQASSKQHRCLLHSELLPLAFALFNSAILQLHCAVYRLQVLWLLQLLGTFYSKPGFCVFTACFGCIGESC
jgi:hypothetical protein